MATTEIIRLEQMPVINHDLLRIGKMVEDRISVLNLDNLVATEDTIKSMKSLRTELNAEFKDFEGHLNHFASFLLMSTLTSHDIDLPTWIKNAMDTIIGLIDE